MYMLFNYTIFSRNTNDIELNYQNSADITKVPQCHLHLQDFQVALSRFLSNLQCT